MAMTSRSTAAILIIGDEILKGETKDTNSHFLCRELYACGVKVCRVSVIADEVDTIAQEVAHLSSQHSFVLTTGGIGPTHDDVTYEGVAKAFNQKIVLNKELQSINSEMCLHLGLDETAAAKMSRVPESSVIHTPCSFIPIVCVKNVYIFPGIPSYLECSFKKLKSILLSQSSPRPFFSRNLFVDASEFEITSTLNAAVLEFRETVRFGSYPILESGTEKVKLSLEADDGEDALEEAEAFLRSHLKENCVVGPHPPRSPEAQQDLQDLCEVEEDGDGGLRQAVKESVRILEECFERYSPEQVALSFNGGKDCTVLLHLSCLILARKFPSKSFKLKVLYVRSQQPFPETEEFIKLSIKRYNLDLLTYEQPIKDAVRRLQHDHRKVQAVLMGSRRTDPHCSNLVHFQMTDPGWPKLMRVNALCDWSYPQIWNFLRRLQVPYCSLYDRGYTSLGCRLNTLPNEQLSAKTKSGETYYLPAYLLKEADQERNGRAASKI